jgi:hypothetical protein
MGMTNAFRDWIGNTATASTATVLFDNGHAYIGVGDSNTAFDAAQTNLQAATNKARIGMESTFPTNVTANIMIFKSSFGSSDGNWAWAEWGIFNHASTGTMMCRKVESLGTKVSGQTWVITATVTISIGS